MKISITRVFYLKPEFERWSKSVDIELFIFTVFKWLRLRYTHVSRDKVTDE